MTRLGLLVLVSCSATASFAQPTRPAPEVSDEPVLHVGAIDVTVDAPPVATQSAAEQTGIRAVPADAQPDTPVGPRQKDDELDRLRGQARQWLGWYESASQDASRVEIARRLDQLAGRLNELASQRSGAVDQLEAIGLALRICRALVLGGDRSISAQERMDQWHALGSRMTDVPHPSARSLGAYWLLQLALVEIHRQELDLGQRQHQTIGRLERFLDEQDSARGGEAPAGDRLDHRFDTQLPSLLVQVRLALLALYDQTGASDQACDLVGRLQADLHRSQVAARQALERLYGYCSRLGHRFEARLRLDDDGTWSSEDHLGQVVVLHFWAPWARPSLDVMDLLRQRYEQLHDRGLAVLSVNVSGSTIQQGWSGPEVDWPTCTQAADQPGLSDLFQVTSLPRFVLVDTQGRVAAIGGQGVLDQAQRLLDAGAVGDRPAPVVGPMTGGQRPAAKQADPPAATGPMSPSSGADPGNGVVSEAVPGNR